MRHRTAGKQLSRNSAHRRALRRNMAASLFENGSIRTTETKAKQLRAFVEKLITLARKDTLAARRLVIKKLQDRFMAERDEHGHVQFGNDGLAELQEKTVIQKLFEEIAPKYADRPGGYTRIIHLAERRIGDAGRQVIIQLVEPTEDSDGTQTSGRRKKRAAKRHAAIEQVAPAAATATAEPEAPADESAPEATEPEAPAEEESSQDEPKAE